MHFKHELINHIIKLKGYKSYLELGYGNGETYNYINCDHKECVDIVRTSKDIPTFLGTTNDFFLQNIERVHLDDFVSNKSKKRFDVVYIDADHHHDQVKNDLVMSSLYCLEAGGTIFMHDVGPLRERDTLLTASGTAYFVWMDLRYDRRNKDETFTYQFNDGDILGVFTPRANHKVIAEAMEQPVHSWDFYQKNKEKILNVKTLSEIEELLK